MVRMLKTICLSHLVFFGVVSSSFKVYDWKRDFGEFGTTQEFAQVHESSQHVLHSAVESGATSYVPSISFTDFNFTAKKFEEGIMAMRPLLSDGNQLCFIARLDTTWEEALSTLQARHKMTISTEEITTAFLRSKLPIGLDPATVKTIADFCDVERDKIFYLRQTSDVSSYNRSIYIQTAFRRFHIGVADNDVPTVFGIKFLVCSYI